MNQAFLSFLNSSAIDPTSTEDAMLYFFAYVVSICVVAIFITFICCAAAYVLRGLAVYNLAKNRKIKTPWLAWIPFARTWLFGYISDDIKAAKGNKKSSRSKILLTFSIIMNALPVLTLAVLIFMAVGIVEAQTTQDAVNGGLIGSSLVWLFVLLFLILCAFVITVLFKIFYFICHYDVYKCYTSKQSALFTVITILADLLFGLPVIGSVLLLAVSNNKPESINE